MRKRIDLNLEGQVVPAAPSSRFKKTSKQMDTAGDLDPHARVANTVQAK